MNFRNGHTEALVEQKWLSLKYFTSKLIFHQLNKFMRQLITALSDAHMYYK